MLDEMTYKHFVEWHAFAELEPFSEIREDVRTASIVQAIMNFKSMFTKARRSFSISDVICRFGDSKGVRVAAGGKTWEQMKVIGQTLTEHYNK